MDQNEQIVELLSGIYIQSLRNYDMLALIADKLGADIISLSNLHENGGILCPNPALVFENDEKDTPLT